MSSESNPEPFYQIAVTLRGVRPTIWRRLHVDSAATLADLHVAIQVAMGWTNSHLHMFITENGVRYGDPTHDDDGFLELDDEVVLEQVHTHDNADALPRCIDAQGRWPASSATDSFACSERHCSRHSSPSRGTPKLISTFAL